MKIHCILLINRLTKSVAHSFSLAFQLLSWPIMLHVPSLSDIYKNKEKNEQESGKQKWQRQQEMDWSCVSILPERLTENIKFKMHPQVTNHIFFQSNYDKTTFVCKDLRCLSAVKCYNLWWEGFNCIPHVFEPENCKLLGGKKIITEKSL